MCVVLRMKKIVEKVSWSTPTFREGGIVLVRYKNFNQLYTDIIGFLYASSLLLFLTFFHNPPYTVFVTS
jgi:hypothetical protein